MQPELIVLGVVMIALTLYALMAGADFGAGIWEFNTALQATEKERKLIYGAIGPVWEANHVWLIFALVVMFGAFPTAFAGLCRALWLPLLMALLGIVFRGVGFAFHSYAAGAVRQQAAWGAVFALASTASPFFLGACIGAVASGHLQVTPHGDYDGDYLIGWISPTAIFSAFFAVAICAYLAAVYLTRDAWRQGDPELTSLWRQRALSSGIWLGVVALSGLGILIADAPELWDGFRGRALSLVILATATGLGSVAALWLRHYAWAVSFAALTVATVLWGWGIAQYPWLVPPTIAIDQAKGPAAVLWLMIGAIAIGTVLVAPALAYLLYLFKGKRPTGDAAAK